MYNYTYNYTCPKCKSYMVEEREVNDATGSKPYLYCTHCSNSVTWESGDYWYREWMTKPYGEIAEAFIKQMIELLEKESNQHLNPRSIALTMKMWMDNTPRGKFLR